MIKRIFQILIISSIIISSIGVSASNITKSISKQSVNFEDYDMAIIAPEMFSEAIDPLISHKNSVGIKTFLKPTEEIYTEYPGRDNAEKIKYFIKDAIEKNNIKYSLLIGSIELVPIRHSAVSLNYQSMIFNEFQTDLYYADIYDASGNFSSWDTNGDNVFGEYIITLKNSMEIDSPDIVDCYPDVGVGRLSCKDIDEVNSVVDKIIKYENQTYGSSWFKRIIVMGGDTFPRNGIIEGERSLNENIIPEMEKHGFESVKRYASEGTFSPKSINQAISDGAGFVSCATHGVPCGLITFPPNKLLSRLFQKRYFTKNIDGMNNGYKLPIFFLECCATGWFSYDIFDLMGFLNFAPINFLKNLLDKINAKTRPCFAWSIVKKQSGGGIASIAASQPIWNDYSYDGGSEFGALVLHRYFIEAYEPGIILSDMMVHAQNSYIDSYAWDRIVIDAYNLIGDPSLKIGGY